MKVLLNFEIKLENELSTSIIYLYFKILLRGSSPLPPSCEPLKNICGELFLYNVWLCYGRYHSILVILLLFCSREKSDGYRGNFKWIWGYRNIWLDFESSDESFNLAETWLSILLWSDLDIRRKVLSNCIFLNRKIVFNIQFIFEGVISYF